MNNSLFRKKNLERISSPEQLNDYIKVSNPSVWLIISAMLILMVAFSVWAFSGNITSEVSGEGVFMSTSQGTVDSVVCYVDVHQAQKISEGMEVRIYNNFKQMEAYVNGSVSKISNVPVKKEDILNSYSNEHIVEHIFDHAIESEYGVGVLIKINKTSDGKYEWANNEVGDESFLKVDNLCGIDIITESVKPIHFLFNGSN